MIKSIVDANKALKSENLVIQTWGNASIRIDDKMYIKPSGVPFENLTASQISRVHLSTGLHVGGKKPSVDAPTHAEIYLNFDQINAIIHTHSKYCTIFAQAKKEIPCLGTTHADYFYGDIPIIEDLCDEEIDNDYEKNIGSKIVTHFHNNGICPLDMRAVLLPSHGVFVWGSSIESALESAIALENIAELAYKTLAISNAAISQKLIDKHFLRKHGDKKYYGQ